MRTGITGDAGRRILPVELEREHFYALIDRYRQDAVPGDLRYVLLSSYEQRLAELGHTRTTLLTVSLAGILFSGLVVWFFIRRITQPQQVVLNIVSNARQALETFRRDGRIVVRTGCEGDRVWLRIIDNGPGISPENLLKKIFDPFVTTKPQGKGTGLGLSLSYGIVQEHRGSIRAESEPGVGTEFILEFPAATPTGAKPVLFRPDTVPPVPAKPPSLRLLVIDDEESILRLGQEILGAEGHRVETAGSGQAALDLILREDYDVIVFDWKMPGLNGINLYQELLTRKPAAAQRMLFMTGDVIKESFQDFLKQHGRTCLPKPFALREFHAAIAGMQTKR